MLSKRKTTKETTVRRRVLLLGEPQRKTKEKLAKKTPPPQLTRGRGYTKQFSRGGNKVFIFHWPSSRLLLRSTKSLLPTRPGTPQRHLHCLPLQRLRHSLLSPVCPAVSPSTSCNPLYCLLLLLHPCMRLTRLFVINTLPVSETQEANRRQVTSHSNPSIHKQHAVLCRQPQL